MSDLLLLEYKLHYWDLVIDWLIQNRMTDRISVVAECDDLGTQTSSPWAREKLYQLFNYRYNAELPTVITTASFPNEMDERLRSRLEGTRLVKVFPITVPSYRGEAPARPKARRGKARG